MPGLYKIFDELLVNACDNFQRDPDHMTYIKARICKYFPGLRRGSFCFPVRGLASTSVIEHVQTTLE